MNNVVYSSGFFTLYFTLVYIKPANKMLPIVYNIEGNLRVSVIVAVELIQTMKNLSSPGGRA